MQEIVLVALFGKVLRSTLWADSMRQSNFLGVDLFRCRVRNVMRRGSGSGKSITSSVRHDRCASAVPKSTWPRPWKHRPPDATMGRGGRSFSAGRHSRGVAVTCLANRTGPNSFTPCPSAACPLQSPWTFHPK